MGVLRNTWFSSINIYFEYLIGLIISILIARSLGPDQYGAYSYLVKIAGISIIFTNAGIGTGAIKFLVEARSSGRSDLLAQIHHYFQKMQRLKTAVIVFCLIAIHMKWPGILVEKDYEYAFFFLLFVIVFKSAHMYRVGVFKGFERFDLLAFSVLIVAPINLLLAGAGAAHGAQLFYFYLIFSGVACVYWVVSGYFLKKIPEINGKNIDLLDGALKTRIKRHLKIVTVNSVIGGLAIGQCEVLLLKHLVDNQSVGFFTIASVISSAALLLVPGVYNAVLFPIIARAVSDVRQDPGQKIQESSRYLFTLGMMVAMPTLYFGEGVVTALYGPEFSTAGLILGLFIFVGALRGFSDPVSAYLMSIDKQSLLLRISIFSLVLSIALNVVLINQFGLAGAVIANCTISLVLISIMLIIAHRHLGIVPEFSKVLRVLFVASLGFLLISTIFIQPVGVVGLVSGYIVFGLIYIFGLIIFNALSEDDYKLLLRILHLVHPKLSDFIGLIVQYRLKV